MRKPTEGTLDRLRRFIKLQQWVVALLEGEMIESSSYTKDYLGFKEVSQEDLDFMCGVLMPVITNHIGYGLPQDFYICNSMGEIIPVFPTKSTVFGDKLGAIRKRNRP